MLNSINNSNETKTSLWKSMLIQKLSNKVVILLLLLASLLFSYIVFKFGIIGGGIVLTLLVGIPILYGIVAYPKFGIAILIFASFFVNYVSEIVPEIAPIGTLLDAITYLLILGFFIKQKREHDWSRFKNPISYIILIWLAYNFIEVINPWATSRLAWVYTVRTVGFIMMMYFVFVYHIRSVDFIKFLLKLWLAFSCIAAISAFQQENFGFFWFEKDYLYADPLRVSLLFINGHMRKFGIFPDPVTFSYNMVVAALLCIALIMGNHSLRKKIALGFMAAFFLFVMLYSGTRAAYVLVPASLLMLAVLNFNKKVMLFAVTAGLMLGFLIVMPTSNPLIKRFQTAFNPSDDPSYNVRAENQKRIKPYILSHPIGGGLGSVGVWGRRFSPNSELSKFPPDSGYVRVAVEMGWIGLILFCTLIFIALYNGINYYYRIRNPELKNYCMAMILVIFAFNIGNFPQQALVQYPSNVLFYLAIAIIVACMRLDNEEQTKIIAQPPLNEHKLQKWS
ncbi:O-Antigen ligase [Mucilaginibacter sp. OK268]|uniref:O-antigen ligase family protein n=1 Tax=Mucilaginibacter sp. OK268 TaxID=1881048 RepID=UPI000885AEA7|nr:O-antigen ligase family protein [Mucilaginibacter sp. OK268]SDP71498.1 O-Antigen ligase [Mucilaginibacter sp. OK268]